MLVCLFMQATDFKQMTSQQMNRWQRDPTKGYGTQRNDTIVDSVVSIGKPAEEGYFDPPHSYQDHGELSSDMLT